MPGLEDAVTAVKGGMAIRAAARQFNVSRSTLHRHINKPRQRGRPTTLTAAKEKLLIQYIKEMASVGFGLSRGKQ